MNHKTLFILRGLPGSGKTTIAQCLAAHSFASSYFAADDYPGLYDEQGNIILELQSEAHNWCFKQVEEEMQRCARFEGCRIILHNTNVRRWEYQPYIDLAKRYGYAVQIIHCEAIILPDGTSPESVHNVPPEVIDRMKNSWQPHGEPEPIGWVTLRDTWFLRDRGGWSKDSVEYKAGKYLLQQWGVRWEVYGTEYGLLASEWMKAFQIDQIDLELYH